MRSVQQTAQSAKPMLHGSFLIALVAIILGSLVTQSATAATCESLASLTLPNTTITKALSVPAGALTPPGAPPIVMYGGVPSTALPAFCYVAGVMTPTSDSVIRI